MNDLWFHRRLNCWNNTHVSGLAQFEENLVQQIRNQDQIIKTLKSRLAAAEQQDQNMMKIVNSFKQNDRTRKNELIETRQILQDSLKKTRELEDKTIDQIKRVEKANKYAEELKLLLHEKDIMINDLRYKMNLSEHAEKNKHLEDKLQLCLREKDAVYKANKILEENYEALNAAQLVRKYISRIFLIFVPSIIIWLMYYYFF